MHLYHNFIDFKKAFDRVWHEALLLTLKKHNIHSNLVHLIGSLHENTSCGVLVDSNIDDWFHTTVGVRQGCLLSPCLFNIFLEQRLTEALESFEGNMRIGGHSINNLHFANDIDLIAQLPRRKAMSTSKEDLTDIDFCLIPKPTLIS